MNLLTIYPQQSCNLKCEQCPNRDWTYPVDYLDNQLTNKDILRWFDAYIKPHRWFLDISGGEPGMYPGIDELMRELEARGYYGIVRTNGTLPIPKTDRFSRVAAWHLDLDSPPEYYDTMFILKKPGSNWEAKIDYCIDNGIPYEAVGYQYYHGENAGKQVNKNPPDKRVRRPVFENWSVVYSSGDNAPCYSKYNILRREAVQKMMKPQLQNLRHECPRCVHVAGITLMVSDGLWRELRETEKRGERQARQ